MLSEFPCWYDNAIVWENHEYNYDNRCTRLHCAPDAPTGQISLPRFWWLNFQMDRSRRLLGVSCSYSNTRHVECLLSNALNGFRCMRKMSHTASLKKCKGNFWQSRYGRYATWFSPPHMRVQIRWCCRPRTQWFCRPSKCRFAAIMRRIEILFGCYGKSKWHATVDRNILWLPPETEMARDGTRRSKYSVAATVDRNGMRR